MMSVVSQMHIISVAQMPGELVNSNIIGLAFHSSCDIYPDLEGLHTGDDGQFAQVSKNWWLMSSDGEEILVCFKNATAP